VDTGDPIDGKATTGDFRNAIRKKKHLSYLSSTKPVTEPLQTGIKSIDAMIPVGRTTRIRGLVTVKQVNYRLY
jgi:F-type H+-transporting ATPase subunit alpha